MAHSGVMEGDGLLGTGIVMLIIGWASYDISGVGMFQAMAWIGVFLMLIGYFFMQRED